MRIIKNARTQQLGMSLPGVLMGVAIMGIVVFAITTLLKDSVLSQKYIEFRQAKENVRLHMIGVLTERISCAATFGPSGGNPGINPTAGANQFTQIRGTTGNIEFQVGDSYERGQLQIVSMNFPTNLPTTPPHTYRQFNAGSLKGAAEFIVGVRNVLPIGGGPAELFFTVKIIADMNAANEIQSCVAVGNDSDDIWRLSAVSEVFYNGGNVGIGNDNPNYTLDVTGNIHTSGTLSVGSRLNSPRIFVGTGGVADGTLTAGTIQAAKFLYTSDFNLKTNIKKSEGLKIVRHLRGVKFNWLESGAMSYGVIAQEVEAVMPSAVTTNLETNTKYVDYAQIVAPLIESAKEISSQNQSLEKRISRLEELLNKK